jgi:hypothetical protein
VIEFFREAFDKASRDFLGFELEAYAVMHQDVYPGMSPSRTEVLVDFLEKYKVELWEKNSKEL